MTERRALVEGMQPPPAASKYVPPHSAFMPSPDTFTNTGGKWGRTDESFY